MTPTAQTLAARLAAGRMEFADAQRYGIRIVDALRQAHEDGHWHGALTPDAVMCQDPGIELVSARAESLAAVTPYTAPERLRGKAPDRVSDIFSLGAVLYHMFTGRAPFPGQDAGELAGEIENAAPPPIGDTALDRLVLNCLVKDPAGRWQHVRQVHMEFKLLRFARALRRWQPSAASRPGEDAGLMEARWKARLDQQARETTAALRQLAGQIPLLEAQVAERLDQQYGDMAAALRQVAGEFPAMEARLVSRLDERHGAAAGEVRHLAGEVAQMEQRLEVRINEQAAALAGLRQAAEESQVEARLAHQEEHESARAAACELEARLVSRLDERHGAAAGEVRHLAGEVAQMEQRLEVRINEQAAALAGLRQAAEESQVEARLAHQEEHESARAAACELEARLVSRLDERHGAAAAEVRHLAGEVAQMEARLEVRINEQAAALAGLRQAAEESQVEARLAHQEEHESARAAACELEARLVSCLDERHDAATAEVRHLAGEVAQMEQRLEVRIGEQAAALAGLRQAAEESQVEARLAHQEEHESARAAACELEARLLARFDQQEAALAAVRQAAAEAGQWNAPLEALREQTTAIETQLAAIRQKDDGGAAAAEIQTIEGTLKSHAAALDSVHAALARSDDFMERVVEALESLQTMVLEKSQDRAA